jgi:hypothetical protein
MLLVKRICIFSLSFLIIASSFASLCFGSFSPFPGADQAANLEGQGHSQHGHGQPSHNHKPPCHKDLLCCPAVAQGSASYSFGLDSRAAIPADIFPQPFEMAPSVYHPPEIRF